MSDIGPVSLDEARDVVSPIGCCCSSTSRRSRATAACSSASPQQARGRTFRVVFVPGLAERMFPQKPHEDPMMLDARCATPLGADLAKQEDRGQAERLLLRLAVGAATERLWLSYPRIDIAESRPRVPSFYALDVMRAITGRIPNHEELQESAAQKGAPAWRGRRRRIRRWRSTISSTISPSCASCCRRTAAKVRGHAHYLLRLNDYLKRSVTARWGTRALAVDAVRRRHAGQQPHEADARLAAAWRSAYSLSALQKFASCPYQFLLSAIYRLEPAEEPEPLQKLDPLTRGALFHEVQAEFFRAMKAAGRLPVTSRDLARGARARSTRIVAGRRREVSRDGSRRRSSACGATRSPTSPRTCASGRGGCRMRATGCRPTSSTASACSD